MRKIIFTSVEPQPITSDGLRREEWLLPPDAYKEASPDAAAYLSLHAASRTVRVKYGTPFRAQDIVPDPSSERK